MNSIRTQLIHGMCLLQLVMVMVMLCLTLPQALAAGSGPYDVRIEQVDAGEFPLVTLFALVTNPASSEIIGDLTQEDFVVTEDGAQVEIVKFSAGNPGTISTVLTIDQSGSMEAEDKLAGAKQAARVFVDQMRPQDQVALIVFDSSVTIWQDFTSDQNQLYQRIDAIALGNGTAWYDGVWRTVDLMMDVTGRRNAILLSDGKDLREGGLLQSILGSAGSQHSFEETIEYARSNSVAIHTIGFGTQDNRDVGDVVGFDEKRLKRMAEVTGGIYHHSPTAEQLRKLYLSFAKNTQKEYVITVRSGRASYDGTRRGLRVTVDGSIGSGDYVEQHLLNVESNLWVALALLAPLALASIAPLIWRKAYVEPPTPIWPSEVDSSPHTSTIRCVQCGHSMRAGARFCSGCGASAPLTPANSPPLRMPSSTAMCNRCGYPLRPNTRYCSQCGQRGL